MTQHRASLGVSSPSGLGGVAGGHAMREAGSALQSNHSTASFYNLPRSSSMDPSSGERGESKVSLWDLRNELRGALAAIDATGEASAASTNAVSVPAGAVHRMLAVMREHVAHNRLQRTLRKEARSEKARADALAADVARLTAQVASLQAGAGPSPTTTGDVAMTSTQEGPAPGALVSGGGGGGGNTSSRNASQRQQLLHSGSANGAPKTPPPYWPTSGVLPFGNSSAGAHGPSAGAPPGALRSGGASSLDGRASAKSDGLAGDEVEALQGRAKDSKDAMRQCAPASFAAWL